jgi:ribonuclease HI
MKELHIWTDGACSGNPGPGGWAVAWKEDSETKILSGYHPQTTNNRMELTAVLQAVSHFEHTHLIIHTDSQGVINWLNGSWKRNDSNIHSLCATIEHQARNAQVTYSFVYVKGHSGDAMNNLVDKEAVKQYKNKT